MDASLTATLAAPALDVVAGRYHLEAEIGRGGYGTVYAATDAVSGQPVAVKRFHSADDEDLLRFGREAAALRLLRHPGVVRLLDHGEHAGTPYLVMERVQGDPFPARPRPVPWAALAPLARALLEVLAAVHDAGIIHRDLKPTNILIDPAGHLTLLDFGLARGAPLGPTLTQAGTALGTPFYLAPEQAFGQHAGPRTDLWAVGALLHEALTGKAPHDPAREDLAGFLVRRGTQPVPPIRDAAPDLPPATAAALDALLALRPEDRPATARKALALLGAAAPAPAVPFPELRPAALARATAVLLTERRALDLTGPRGAGAGHLLERLASLTPRAVRAAPARVPYQSLAPLLGPLDTPADTPLEAFHALARAAATRAFAAGAVLLVADWAGLDRFSRRLLLELGPHVPIARAVAPHALDPARAALDLPPLAPADLAALFTGPDRILHLREDAAAELHRRSRGLPGPAVVELERWLRVGLAERDGALVRVSRANLERLASDSHAALSLQQGARLHTRESGATFEASAAMRRATHLRDVARLVALAGDAATLPVVAAAWRGPRWLLEAALDELERLGALARLPDGTLALDGVEPDHLDGQSTDRAELHAALADALPADDPRRVLHLVAAQRVTEAVEGALPIARALEHRGAHERASAVLHDALALARAVDRADLALAVLRQLTLLAQLDSSEPALERTAYELRPERGLAAPEPAAARLRALIDAALHGARHGGAGVLELLAGFAAPDDVELDVWAWSLRVRAARAEPVEREAAIVAAACAWADAAGTDLARVHALSWRGRLAYREAHWDAAGEAHAATARDAVAPLIMRLAAATNAASAFMEAARFEEALEFASWAAEHASRCRHAVFELRAHWLARALRLRMALPLAPDPELAQLAARSGAPHVEVLLRIVEATRALRAEDRDELPRQVEAARALARRLRMDSAERILAALAWVGAGEAPAEDVAEVLGQLDAEPHAGIRLQVLALAALADAPLTAAAAELAAASWRAITDDARHRRLDVLTPAEAQALLDARRSGRWEAAPPALSAWRPERRSPRPTGARAQNVNIVDT